MPKPLIVLFDMDETLIHTGGSGARSWSAAFEKLYGVPADIGEHGSAGETDPVGPTLGFHHATAAGYSWMRPVGSETPTPRPLFEE